MNSTLDTFTSKPIPLIQSKRLILIVSDGWRRDDYIRLLAAVALRGPASIIAGSDWVPGYGLAHEIRRHSVNVKRTLEGLQLSRAFTCYQLLDLLATFIPNKNPLLILDCLHTFYDPDIPLDIRVRTLKQSADQLQRLARSVPIAVIVQPSLEPDYERFYSMITAISDEVLQAISVPQETLQPNLFRSR